MIDFTKAEVGLEVNDPRFGNGVISSTRINPYAGEGFKVSVRFEGITKYFTADGRYLSEQCPTLRVGHFDPIVQGEIPKKGITPLLFDGTPAWAYVAVSAEHIDEAKRRGPRLVIAHGCDGYAAIHDGDSNTESSGISHWKFAWEIEDD